MSDEDQPLRILIVEDERSMAETLALLLSDELQASVEFAWSCAEAREMLATGLYDTVTIDYRLPDGSGLELLREVCSVEAHPPVLLVTGRGDEETAVRAFRYGAAGYVVKDARIADRLLDAVRKVVAEVRLRGAERALLESQRRYRALVESVNDLIWEMNTESEFTYVSPRSKDILGYGPEEMVGRSLFEFMSLAETRTAAEALSAYVPEMKPFALLEMRLLHAGGSEVDLEMSGVPLLDEEMEFRGYRGVSRDVSRRKEAERALRLTGFAVDNVRDMVLIADPDAAIRYANDAICDALGYTREQICGMAVFDIDHDFTTDIWPDYWRDIRERGTLSFESRLVSSCGSEVQVEVTMNHLEFEGSEYNVAFIRDITERRLAEGMLRMAAERANALADFSHQVSMDGLDYEAVLHNTARSAAEVVGDGCVLAILSKNGSELVPVAVDHREPEAASLLRELIISRPGGLNEWPVIRAAHSGEMFLAEQIDQEALRAHMEPGYLPWLDRYGIHSLLVLPLCVSGRTLGTLGVSRDSPGGVYSEEDVSFLEALAGRAALAIDNAGLFDLVNIELQERRLAERKYRELVENANSIIMRLDPGGNILFLNQCAKEFFGYAGEELIGRNVLGTIVPETDSAGRDLRDRIEAVHRDPDRYALNENENVKKSGELAWVAWTNKGILDGKGRITGILCVGTDMTERMMLERLSAVQRELALRLSGASGLDEVLETVMSAATSASGLECAEIRLASTDGAGFELRCSRGLSGEFVRRASGLDISAEGILPPDAAAWLGLEELPEAVRGLYLDEGITSLAVARITAEGAPLGTLCLSSRGAGPIGDEAMKAVAVIAGQAGQAVARASMVESVRDSETRYRLLYDNAGDAIFTYDLKLVVTGINRLGAEMVGKTRDEIIGRNIIELGIVAREDLGKATELGMKVLAGDRTARGEIRFLGAGGLERVCEVTVAPVLGPDGEVAETATIVRDITERKQAEEALRESRERLRDFVGIAAHELRHPAAVIKGCFEVMEEQGAADSEEMERLLSLMGAGVSRLTLLVDELFETSRLELGPPALSRRETELGPIVGRALEEVARRGPLEFNSRVEEATVVTADAANLRQALMILLDNARLYSEEGAEVTVTAGQADGGMVEISVLDRGAGVPSEELERIFEPCYRGRNVQYMSVPGIGVGLYIARKIVEAHGGKIWCEPREGGGSVFKLTIPAAAAEAGPR